MNFHYSPSSFAIVHCDGGFDVEFTGRFELTYREGDRQMRCYIQEGQDDHGKAVVAVGTGGLERWLPPFADEYVPDLKQADIRGRIAAAIEFTGAKCEFHPWPYETK
jgi:hypothetical protein